MAAATNAGGLLRRLGPDGRIEQYNQMPVFRTADKEAELPLRIEPTLTAVNERVSVNQTGQENQAR